MNRTITRKHRWIHYAVVALITILSLFLSPDTTSAAASSDSQARQLAVACIDFGGTLGGCGINGPGGGSTNNFICPNPSGQGTFISTTACPGGVVNNGQGQTTYVCTVPSGGYFVSFSPCTGAGTGNTGGGSTGGGNTGGTNGGGSVDRPPTQDPPLRSTLTAVTQCNDTKPRIVLSWTPVQNADSYRIQRNGIVVREFSTNATSNILGTGLRIPMPANTWIDYQVAADTTYTYTIQTVNTRGATTSAPVRITPSACSGKPGEVSLTATTLCSAEGARAKLTWTPSAKADYYKLVRTLDRTDGGGKVSQQSFTVPTTSPTENGRFVYVFPGTGKTTFWQVQAFNASGSANSNIVQGFAPDPTTCTSIPTTPNPLYPTEGSYQGSITDLPANHTWDQLEISGLRLNGGSVSVRLSGKSSNYQLTSGEFQLTEAKPRINLGIVPQIADSTDIQITFTLRPNADRSASPQFASFSATAKPVQTTDPTPAVDAAITATPNSGTAPLKVEFTYNRPYVPESYWTWRFGDGQSESGNPYFRNTASHTYSEPGTYQVQIVNDRATCLAIGCEIIASTTVTVDEQGSGASNAPASTESATLTMGSPSYAAEDTISAAVTNTGQTPLTTCNDPIAYSVYRTTSNAATSDTLVFSSTGGTFLPLAPNESRTLTWNQRGNDGQLVGSGSYRLLADCGTAEPTATFTITGPTSTTPTTTFPDSVTLTFDANGSSGDILPDDISLPVQILSNGSPAKLLSNPGACGAGALSEASSQPNFVTGNPSAVDPLVFTLREGTSYRAVTMQLVSVGSSGVTITYRDRGGNVLKQDSVANPGTGVGCLEKDTVQYSIGTDSSAILGRVEITGTGDGFGVDDVQFTTTRLTDTNRPTPGSAAPNNSLSVSPTSGAAPLTVTATVPRLGFSVNFGYRIDWGDGQQERVSLGQTLTHTYQIAGTYTAKLQRNYLVASPSISEATIEVINVRSTPTTPTLPSGAVNQGLSGSTPTTNQSENLTPNNTGPVTLPSTNQSTTTPGVIQDSSRPSFLQRFIVFPAQNSWNWFLGRLSLR